MPIDRYRRPDEIRAAVRQWHREGLEVGFVPTMGALHEGHLSLVRAAAAECDRVVVSVYLNPTQFAPEEDLDSYPRRLNEDCRLAEEAGVAAVFCPTDEVMYPSGYATYVGQKGLTEVLEGAHRPTHFRDVLTIVCKLLNCVPADRAFFGQKDFQQTVVIRRMVRDLDMAAEIRVMPTVREPDGLAKSSRNEYLSEEERRQALCLCRALREARERYGNGDTDADAARRAMRQIIAAEPLAESDYVEVVDCETLEPVRELSDRAVAVLAVRVGETRLIDNLPLAGPLE